MPTKEILSDPVFDSEDPGGSLDRIYAKLPLDNRYFGGMVLGDHKTKRKGQGYELETLREMEPEDEWSRVDFRATALAQREADRPILVRDEKKEVAPPLFIVTDMLQSRNNVKSPWDRPGEFPEQLLAVSAVTALMRMAHQQKMPWAVIASNDHNVAVAQRHPVQGRRAMLGVAQQMANVLKADTTTRETKQRAPYQFADLLRFAGGKCTKGIVAIVSDFRDTLPDGNQTPGQVREGWRQPLLRLAARGNQLIAVETTNPYDFALPEEEDVFWINGRPEYVGYDKKGKAKRAAHVQDARRRQSLINETIAGAGAHHVRLRTEEPQWTASLQKQLQRGGGVRANEDELALAINT